jgi:hypothetical protein
VDLTTNTQTFDGAFAPALIIIFILMVALLEAIRLMPLQFSLLLLLPLPLPLPLPLLSLTSKG